MLATLRKEEKENTDTYFDEAARDADPMDLALVPSARLALRRLAAANNNHADSRVDDSWPVVVDRLRMIRIELLDLPTWALSAATRTAEANRSLRACACTLLRHSLRKSPWSLSARAIVNLRSINFAGRLWGSQGKRSGGARRLIA
jgi:hypothetical protein